MQDSIPVYLERVIKILNEFRRSGRRTVPTSDILRKYSGGFYANRNIASAYSFNALFGKVLKRHGKDLSIKEVQSNVRITDDLKRQTKASIWLLK